MELPVLQLSIALKWEEYRAMDIAKSAMQALNNGMHIQILANANMDISSTVKLTVAKLAESMKS